MGYADRSGNLVKKGDGYFPEPSRGFYNHLRLFRLYRRKVFGMELTIHSKDEHSARIGISGAVTQKKVSQAEKLLPELLGKDVYSKKVLVSLKDTDFIDSSGINWLLICHKHFVADGGRLVLHSIPELADKVLKILRLENVFEMADDEASALRLANEPRATGENGSESSA